MIIKLLTLEEIKQVYQAHMKRDFPPTELRTLKSIQSLHRQGLYECFGYFDEDLDLVAYAFCAKSIKHSLILLDYYAVISTKRQNGIGSQFLQALKPYLKADGILIEVETPEVTVSKEENQIRSRRIAFYERNGAHLTAVGGSIFGVHFTVMYLPLQQQLPDKELLSNIQQLYRQMVPASLFKLFVHYRLLK